MLLVGVALTTPFVLGITAYQTIYAVAVPSRKNHPMTFMWGTIPGLHLVPDLAGRCLGWKWHMDLET